MEADRKSNEKEAINRKKAVCDVEALKKCLEENKGDQTKCQHHIEAFRNSCSIKKPNSENWHFYLPDYHMFSPLSFEVTWAGKLEEFEGNSSGTVLSTLCMKLLACQEWGFFHITNHGISDDLCRKMQNLSSQIFTLPSELKNKAGPLSDVKTYTPHFIASPFYESLRVSGPDFFGSAQGSSEALMSQPNSEFSEILQEYGRAMAHLSKTILETIIKCLGTDFESKHLSEFNNCHGYMRINNYSSQDIINNSQETEGLGMHTDMSCITIVYQDEIGGLQVRSKEGQWMDINPRKNTFVVNIGDLLQAWSNGMFRSSEHRVVLRKNVQSRFSVAFFWCFEDDKVIFAPEEVVGDMRSYKAFVCGDYVRFRENSEKGKFEKVGFNVKHFAGTEM